MVQVAQILFGVTTFYYTINLIMAYKKEGRTAFWANKWNWADIMTVVLSIIALGLYLLLKFVLIEDMKIRVSAWLIYNHFKSILFNIILSYFDILNEFMPEIFFIK